MSGSSARWRAKTHSGSTGARRAIWCPTQVTTSRDWELLGSLQKPWPAAFGGASLTPSLARATREREVRLSGSDAMDKGASETGYRSEGNGIQQEKAASETSPGPHTRLSSRDRPENSGSYACVSKWLRDEPRVPDSTWSMHDDPSGLFGRRVRDMFVRGAGP
jgi:hypothetical protein